MAAGPIRLALARYTPSYAVPSSTGNRSGSRPARLVPSPVRVLDVVAASCPARRLLIERPGADQHKWRHDPAGRGDQVPGGDQQTHLLARPNVPDTKIDDKVVLDDQPLRRHACLN